MEEILNQISQSGYRLTRARQAIVSVIESAADTLSPEALLERGKQLEPSLGLVSVYRTLTILESLGIVRRVHLEDGCRGYARAASTHGHLLICRVCGQVVEFEGCDLGAMISSIGDQTGFKVDDHLLELSGICSSCSCSGALADG